MITHLGAHGTSPLTFTFMEGCGALVQLDCYQYTGKDVCYKIYYDNLPGYTTVHVGGHPQVSIEVKVV